MTIVVWLIAAFIAFCLVMRRVGNRERKIDWQKSISKY